MIGNQEPPQPHAQLQERERDRLPRLIWKQLPRAQEIAIISAVKNEYHKRYRTSKLVRAAICEALARVWASGANLDKAPIEPQRVRADCVEDWDEQAVNALVNLATCFQMKRAVDAEVKKHNYGAKQRNSPFITLEIWETGEQRDIDPNNLLSGPPITPEQLLIDKEEHDQRVARWEVLRLEFETNRSAYELLTIMKDYTSEIFANNGNSKYLDKAKLLFLLIRHYGDYWTDAVLDETLKVVYYRPDLKRKRTKAFDEYIITSKKHAIEAAATLESENDVVQNANSDVRP